MTMMTMTVMMMRMRIRIRMRMMMLMMMMMILLVVLIGVPLRITDSDLGSCPMLSKLDATIMEADRILVGTYQ